jgi:hypothetical protein
MWIFNCIFKYLKIYRFEIGSRPITLVGEVTAHQGYDG